MAKRKRMSHPTEMQKSILVDCMKENENLIFDPKFTTKMAQDMWCELSQTLNSLAGGAKKNWKSWRKTWHDMKCRTKLKKKQLDRESLTNERQVRPFTVLEERIMTVLKKQPCPNQRGICKGDSDSSNDEMDVPKEYEDIVKPISTPNTLHMFLPRDPLKNSGFSQYSQPTSKVETSPTKVTQLAASSNIKVKSIPLIITPSASTTNQPFILSSPTSDTNSSVKKTDECFSDCRHQRMLNAQLKRKNDIKETYYKKKLEILDQCKDGFLQLVNQFMKK